MAGERHGSGWLFVGGRIKSGHDGKILNSNTIVMRVLDTRIHDSSFRRSIRFEPDSSGLVRGIHGRSDG
jgi:hypothetical protein